VTELAEVTENTQRGARGSILPAATGPGNPTENTLLPDTVAELTWLELSRARWRWTAPSCPAQPTRRWPSLRPERVFISGRQERRLSRTKRRLQRYRTGAEGRISHLKRRYGLNRSRLKGAEGQRIWTEWSILAYDLDTLAVRTG
jgi:Transposase DDE domain